MVFELAEVLPGAHLKTVKFKENPQAIEVAKQVKSLNHKFLELLKTPKNIGITLKQNSTKQRSSVGSPISSRSIRAASEKYDASLDSA